MSNPFFRNVEKVRRTRNYSSPSGYDDEIYTIREPRIELIWSTIIIAVLSLIFALGAYFTSVHKVAQSDVGVGISRGTFDPNAGKVTGGLLGPGRHIVGLNDDVWTFPAYKTLRYQDFDVRVTTKDGKQLDIQGQYGFRFVGEHNPALAVQFAKGIGSRKYGGKRPGESDDGWSNFLDKMVDPDVVASFKDQFGRSYCADFEPSCRSIDPRKDIPDTTPESVYTSVATAVSQKVTDDLGAPYLQDFRIKVKKIILPEEVQRNIDLVTAEQAKTKSAQQAEKTAEAEATAIETKAKALKQNQELVAVEVAKACTGNCSIIVDATGKGVAPTINANK